MKDWGLNEGLGPNCGLEARYWSVVDLETYSRLAANELQKSTYRCFEVLQLRFRRCETSKLG